MARGVTLIEGRISGDNAELYAWPVLVDGDEVRCGKPSVGVGVGAWVTGGQRVSTIPIDLCQDYLDEQRRA